MDQVTQQNAALVEEMAAAAPSLTARAQKLLGGMAAFQLAGRDGMRLATPSDARRITPVVGSYLGQNDLNLLAG